MQNRHQSNVELIFAVAERLGELVDKVVFCGGAVTGLLITDRAAPDVSSTKDVDAIVEVASFGEYAEAQEAVRKLGFKHDLSADAPNCRFIVDGIIVDLMPTDGSTFGWATTFYPAAVESAEQHELTVGGKKLAVKVISAPLFVATKLEAFADRGKGDYGGSKDMADVIAVVDGRVELPDELEVADMAAQKYVRSFFARLITDTAFNDVVDYFGGDGGIILSKLESMAQS